MTTLKGMGQRALGAVPALAVTHLAFYAGWPAAATAARLLGDVPTTPR
ncbi:hypothetical protein NX784_14840 [Massilia pinisoli]|uniref:Uncharacterized protein n=1 Tax=Massilia pinisoli TaxID=1772194 RepID=A0ABT1ZSF7_9BURK|nr:hypothetical protein [Massilia pinisoli]MCS0582866.1 hypothetical protein [Massilia pinisoli]